LYCCVSEDLHRFYRTFIFTEEHRVGGKESAHIAGGRDYLTEMAKRYVSSQEYQPPFTALTSPDRYKMVAQAFKDLGCRVEKIR